MNVLDQYNKALAIRAKEEHELAQQSLEKEDERMHSIHLMLESMCGDMLRELGKAQHHAPQAGVMRRMQERALQEEAQMKQRDDFDSADRARLKAETIAWAMNTLKELEEQHAESSFSV